MDVKLLSATDFEAITAIILSLLDWSGSLEDASVVWLTRSLKCPVWTLNYRDFGRFQDLEFWNPRL